ncbi:MAG: hypothetical protein ACRDSS_10280, partial [Actinocrinis sp.]
GGIESPGAAGSTMDDGPVAAQNGQPNGQQGSGQQGGGASTPGITMPSQSPPRGTALRRRPGVELRPTMVGVGASGSTRSLL